MKVTSVLLATPILNIFSRFNLPSFPSFPSLPSIPQPTLSPPSPSDLDSCADLLIDIFFFTDPPPPQTPPPLWSPSANLSIKSLKRRTSKELEERIDSPNDYMFCSKDPSSGDVVGFVELRVRNFGIKDALDDGPVLLDRSGVYEYFPNSPPPERLSFMLTPVITNLIVAPEYRGTGLGSKLVKSCIVKAKSLEFDTIALQVEKSNLKSISWYEGLGFEKVSVLRICRRLCRRLNAHYEHSFFCNSDSALRSSHACTALRG